MRAQPQRRDPETDGPDEERRLPLPRWVVPLLSVVALVLVPWTLWLTFSLPSRHVSHHYDVAWVGFDVGLLGAFAATTFAAIRSAAWLEPIAAVTGTMLACDAWFDVVTSASGDERLVAIAEAVVAELPLALLCFWIVRDAQRFRDATILRYAAAYRRLRGREDDESLAA